MGCLCSKLHALPGTSRNIDAGKILPKIHAIRRLVPGLGSLTLLHPNHAQLQLNPSLLTNPNLLLYIEAYITNATSAIEFLNDILPRLDGSRNASSSLKGAVLFFNKKDYIQTLSKMKDFADASNPFTAQLFDEHCTVVKQHRLVRDTTMTMKQKLATELSFVKSSRKVWEAVCKAALVLVLVSAMVLASLGLPPVAATAASLGSAIINTVEPWLDAILKGREDELVSEMEIIRQMFTGSLIGGNLETLRALAERVENHLGLLAKDVEFVLRVEDEMALMVAFNGIGDGLTELDIEIKRLETKVKGCISEINDAVTAFFKLIIAE